jgi:hypothetical protein
MLKFYNERYALCPCVCACVTNTPNIGVCGGNRDAGNITIESSHFELKYLKNKNIEYWLPKEKTRTKKARFFKNYKKVKIRN